MAGVHVGDTKTRFQLTIKDETNQVVDLADATTTELYLFKPDGSTIVRPLTKFTDGTDGILFYDVEAGDLDIPGLWRYQAHIVLPTGEKHTSILSVRVLENLR